MATTALDGIDEVARGLAQAALSGAIEEAEARAGLCTLLLTSRVTDAVAWSQVGLSVQQHIDLAENLLAILVDRVLDPSSSFDLVRVAQGSFCGWARMLGIRVARWDKSVRPVGVDAITVRVSPLPPTAPSETRADAAELSYHSAQASEGLSAEDAVLGDWTDSER